MHRRGFTFIEMITVTVVLALAATLIAPSLSSSMKAQARRTFLRGLPRLAAQARQQAIDSGAVVTMAMEGNAVTLSMGSGDQEEESRSIERLNVPQDLSLTDYRLNGQEVGDGDWFVRFFSDGTSDSAALVISENGGTLLYRVNANNAVATLGAGDVNEEVIDRWPAGDYVQRG
ncbi:MAG TPA: type II secretion system protein [Fimbriimonadaceae bacterium]|nr:type II secretion system protein [Fimbriimonadaceae bacterium]